MLATGLAHSGWAMGFGFLAVILASVNIFGGFLVTQRMLAMFKRAGGNSAMSAEPDRLLLPDRRGPVHPGAARPVEPRHLPPGQPLRHGRHGVAILARSLTGMSGVGYVLILIGIAIGGSIGAVVAHRIQMTALPQLVAAFHSLVGLAAVFVAAAALNAPEAFGIGVPGASTPQSLVEMSLGLAIGAITFSGSLIAFAKLQALMKGAPIIFPISTSSISASASCWCC